MSNFAAMILVFLAAATKVVIAAEFPSERITMLVGYSAGGSTDAAARIMAPRLGARLGTTVIVENRAGASGMIAARSVAQAPKDGNTLLFAAANEVSVLASVSRNMPYDPHTAFAPISLIGTFPFVLVVHPSLSVSSVSELVELAKKQPGRLSYASVGGVGTTSHLASELFKAETRTDIVHVPYKGGGGGAGGVMPDLLSGRVQVMFHVVQVALPHIKSGALKAIAYTGTKRSPFLPGVPTMEEAGMPRMVVGSWVGVLAPSGTPVNVINRLDHEIRAAAQSADAQELLKNQGVLLDHKSPAEFAKFIDAEIVRWTKLAREAHISIE